MIVTALPEAKGTQSHTGPSIPAPKPKVAQRRNDLDGLRAIAALLVVLFHASIPGFSGGFIGVDVFFVLSGYFITGILLKDIQKFGRVRFAEFYSRRARRLMPAATLVLFCTAVVVWYVMPTARLRDSGIEIFSAGTYLANFRFAGQATNYFATQDPSPVLHYWSLAVEEQFYVFWPIFLLGCARLSRRFKRDLTTLGIVGVSTTSLLACVWYTFHDQPVAFYMFPLRAWQLGLGALAHIAVTSISTKGWKMPFPLAWIGLAGIVIPGFTYTESMAYPGYAALLPAFGCFLLVISGPELRGPARILEIRPLVQLGNWSYSIYLWHWPLLVLTVLWLGRKLSMSEALAMVGISVLLGYLTYRFWENPMRHARLFRVSNISTTILTVVFLTSSIVPAISVIQQGTFLMNSGQTYKFSAIQTPKLLLAAISGGASLKQLPNRLTPSLANVERDNPPVRDCFLQFEETTIPTNCSFGDSQGEVSIVLTGDSHAHQWFSAVQAVALKHKWKLYFFGKSSCPFTTEPARRANGDLYRQCDSYQKNALKKVREIKPDLLILGQARGIVGWSMPAFGDMVKKVRGKKNLILLGDNPYPESDAELRSTCISRNSSNIAACNLNSRKATSSLYNNQLVSIARENHAEMLPVEQWFCAKDVCPVIVNNIQVYRTGQHVTSTYVTFLAPFFESELNKALKRLQSPLKWG